MKRLFCLLLAALLLPVLGGCGTDAEEAQPIDYTERTYTITDEHFKRHGRTEISSGVLLCDETGSGIEFTGYMQGRVTVTMNALNGVYFTVYIDGERVNKRFFANPSSNANVEVANFEEGGKHTIKFVRQTEGAKALCEIKTVTLNGQLEKAPENKDLLIEFIGDSITAGYGVLYPQGQADAGSTICQDGTQTYAWLTAEALNADATIVCRSGIGVTAGHTPYNMDTYYSAACYNRTPNVPYNPTRTPDIIVVNLGTNDAMSKLDADEFIAEIETFIKMLRKINGEDVPIFWVYGMMNDAKWNWTNTAMQNLGGEGAGLYGVKMPLTRDGGNNHPSLEAHENAASILTNIIKQKIK